MTVQFGTRSTFRSEAARRIEAAGRAFQARGGGADDIRPARPPAREIERPRIHPLPVVVLPPAPTAPAVEVVPKIGPLITEHPKLDMDFTGIVHRILAEVSEKYRMPVKDIIGARRSKPFIGPRHEAIYRAVSESSLALPAIGRLFNRDHTSIGFAVVSHCRRTGDPFPRGIERHSYAQPRRRDRYRNPAAC